MNRFCLVLCLTTCLFIQSFAQAYQVGNTTVNYFDSARGRIVPTDIFYPANTTGSNVAIAIGSFPILVFGHGFSMGTGSYSNFVNALVPKGYILAMPSTETGFSPDHLDFAEDLSYLIDKIRQQNTNSNSVLFGSVGQTSAVMGHSMGGGSSVIAASINPNITAMVNFAAAETTPSAISAASLVQIPSLIFSGEEDCVSPDSTNQLAIYNSLNSSCKYHIQIKQGGHCYFADYNFNCTFGESFCLPVVPISRAQQHDVTFDFLIPWLSAKLKGNSVSNQEFQDSVSNSNRVNTLESCFFTTSINDEIEQDINIYPNPTSGLIHLMPDFQHDGIEVYNLQGEMVFTTLFSNIIDLGFLSKGTYFVRLNSASNSIIKKIIIQ